MLEKGTTIPVLDKGYVKLIDHMGSDEGFIEAARMSTGKGFQGWDKDMSLLTFLWRNQHTTPFEMAELHVEVKAPIMVFREWHRHRTFSFNEFSARYAQMPDEHYLPDVSRIQRQSTANKQGSAEALPEDQAHRVLGTLSRQQTEVYDYYDHLVREEGVAKEVARLNTPVSRYSVMRAKTDTLNWLRFLKLRMAPTAQLEIRQYAVAIGEQFFAQLWPRTWELFLEYDLLGGRLSATEMRAVRALFGKHPSTAKMLAEAAGGMTEDEAKKFVDRVLAGGR